MWRITNPLYHEFGIANPEQLGYPASHFIILPIVKTTKNIFLYCVIFLNFNNMPTIYEE